MFRHIPEEVFCPQVSGNVQDALRVLRVRLEGPEKSAYHLDMELSLVDPENPVTQVSKTPSDEEFPWCEDIEADAVVTSKEGQQIVNISPDVAEDMEDNTKQKTEVNKNEIGNKGGKEDVVPEQGRVAAECKTDRKEDGEASPTDVMGLKVEELDKEPQISNSIPRAGDPDKERKEREEKMISDFKNLAFPKRPKSNIKSELLVKDVKKFIEDMKNKTAPHDLDARIIPSNMACRYELPIDMRRLKGESPLSYLKKYCKVTDSRKAKYKEKFEGYKSELKTVTVLNLQKIYESLYHESTLQYEVMHLQRLLVINLSMELDVETFIIISCLMERIMLKSRWRGPFTEYRKNMFEATNFYALDGKLQDIDISPQIITLLKYIRGT